MRILYLGDDFSDSTSAHRAAALGRLGHDVMALNPRAHIPSHRVVSGFNVRTGYRLFAPWVGGRLQAQIAASLGARGWTGFDCVWIDGCPELPLSLYRWMEARGWPMVCYHIDDPFGTRDRRKWDLMKQAVRFHDLTVVVREENVAEAKHLGARSVERVYRSYDPIAHAPRSLGTEERASWGSEVAFIGTWMPERGPFLSRLLELGVPLSIWGDLWPKAAEWPRLRGCWRGPAIYGRDYVKAIQCARIALGLLSKGNRDLHTTRSAEVPFIGGAVFCAERTTEHLHLFEEGTEAIFWDDADECAASCRHLLANPRLRAEVAALAQRRIVGHGLANDEVIRGLLAHESIAPRHSPSRHVLV